MYEEADFMLDIIASKISWKDNDTGIVLPLNLYIKSTTAAVINTVSELCGTEPVLHRQTVGQEVTICKINRRQKDLDYKVCI